MPSPPPSKPKAFDPVKASLLQRLEHHYRENFPRMVKHLEEQQRFKEFLARLKERYQEIVDEQLRTGKMALYQAQELAEDVVFQKPGPNEAQEQEQSPE